jgi:hypothetical protein
MKVELSTTKLILAGFKRSHAGLRRVAVTRRHGYLAWHHSELVAQVEFDVLRVDRDIWLACVREFEFAAGVLAVRAHTRVRHLRLLQIVA